ncbi:MAG: hypothetical protein KGV50_00210 [Gammaproteobacteria bacterium]|nr:hypothetical protein [Gammaproteobacteria bacterium]
MFKHILFTSLLLSSISYGQDSATKTTQSKETVSAAPAFQGKVAQVPAPKVSDIPLKYPHELADVAKQTADTFQTKIVYTPSKNEETYYFDKDENVVKKPVVDGFYRKILGTTAEGQIVGQDFYQDGKSPQTAPFLFIKGASLTDFDTSQNEGEMVWFKKDGAIDKIAILKSGKISSSVVFCDNEYICLQTTDQSVVVYYKNSDNIMFYAQGKSVENLTTVTLFRKDSSALFKMSVKDDKKNILAWDASGATIEPELVKDEAQGLFEKLDEVLIPAYVGDC